MIPEESFSFILSEKDFRFILHQEMRFAIRHSHYLSLLMLKLNGSDEHDHLMSVMDCIRDDIRETDYRGAFQDQKVAIIIRMANPDDLVRIMSRLGPIIQDHPVCSQQAPCRYELAVGGACFPNDGATPGDLLSAAEGNCKEL
jgi:GGDEF domain-containing protein